MSGKLRWLLVLTLGVLLAGCAPAAATGITVTDAWARTSAMVDRAGAAYMVLHNGGATADKLLSASSPAAACPRRNATSCCCGSRC